MGGVDRQFGVVVGGGHLDHVDSDDVVLEAELPHQPQQVCAGDAARLRGAGTRRVGRIEHVDVDGDVQLVGLRERLGDGVAHDLLEAALPNLLHRVPRHALLEHPLERVLGRPIAAQPDLYEVRTRHRTRLDQPPHRRAV